MLVQSGPKSLERAFSRYVPIDQKPDTVLIPIKPGTNVYSTILGY